MFWLDFSDKIAYMKYRIFIAINLPEEIKTNLGDFQKKYSGLPARWIKPGNMHITLEFLGYIDEEAIEELKQIISKITAKHSLFPISLTNICYAPPKITPPRMIWAMGEQTESFTSLKDDLEKELSKSAKIRFIPERKEPMPHVTLARIKDWEWRRIEPEERPGVGERVNFEVPVESIDLMESVLKKSGPEYTILESFNLNK